jgi:hypothetical protein
MKNIILIAILAFAMNAKAQITLEHKYDNASTLNIDANTRNQLMIINFEISGERYVKINRSAKNISIYNLNHSLLKTIDCSSYPLPSNQLFGDILYISEQLFDTDSAMEWMYLTGIPGSSYDIMITQIYKEDGTLIFSDTGAPMIHFNILLQQYPIYNTSQGTKMILSYPNGQAWVYSLPGTLSAGIAEANTNLIAIQSSSVSNAYPNPSNNTTQIDYTLPDDINEGEIVFYDLLGNEVKRFKVDRTFNTLLVSTADIAAGTYFYQLQTSVENSEGKKMVVIK